MGADPQRTRRRTAHQTTGRTYSQKVHLMSMVSVRGVTKSFPVDGGMVNALSAIHLDIAAGELVSIIGPSGCGKSTLLRILAGLEQQTLGDIMWEDRKGRDKVGFVFQEPVLLPWKSALANICFARPSVQSEEHVGDVDEKCDLEEALREGEL